MNLNDPNYNPGADPAVHKVIDVAPRPDFDQYLVYLFAYHPTALRSWHFSDGAWHEHTVARGAVNEVQPLMTLAGKASFAGKARDEIVAAITAGVEAAGLTSGQIGVMA